MRDRERRIERDRDVYREGEIEAERDRRRMQRRTEGVKSSNGKAN